MILEGKFLYKGKIVEGCIVIENGRIIDIRKSDNKTIKVEGIILPAGIDAHVHFRDFKEKYKETIETGSLSALYGGICLVVDQPNTNPPIVDVETYLKRMELAKKTTYVDYSLNLGLTEDNKHEIGEIIKNIEEKYVIPAIGEVFLHHEKLQVSYETLRSVKIDKLITVHAEDPELAGKKEGEIKAVKECLKFGDFYFCHISTPEALKIIANSNSFVEVTPHHLLLTYNDTDFKVNPPLRSDEDRINLLKNIDKVDVIASDHAPHTIEDKKDGAPGFPGVETMYPLMLGLVKKGVLDLVTVVERIAINPAQIFGFKGYGEIEIGNYANLAIFDFSNVEKIKADRLHSKAGWTPYENFEAIFPKAVYLRGVKVLEDREVLIDKGFGLTFTKDLFNRN